MLLVYGWDQSEAAERLTMAPEGEGLVVLEQPLGEHQNAEQLIAEIFNRLQRMEVAKCGGRPTRP